MRLALACLLTAGCNHAAPPASLSLPQAIDGALWVNPAAYAEVPLKIDASGPVRVTLDGANYAAVQQTATRWVAMLPVAALSDGEYPIIASRDGSEARATLRVGRSGAQLTDFAQVGAARSPRVHRFPDGSVRVTWTDRQAGSARAWMQKLDGAGRLVGERTLVVEDPVDEVHFARVALGRDSLGVLFQTTGVPYKNWFTVVGLDGAPRMARFALEDDDWHGTWGGDVSFDGAAFVAAWRSQGPGPTKLSWLRVEEGSGEVVGPVEVAHTGAGTAEDPIGSFEGFSFVNLRTLGERSLIGFVRNHWQSLLKQAIPRAELALVHSDGTVESTQLVGSNGFYFYRESRVYKVGEEFVPIWSAKNLRDEANHPRNVLYAARSAALPVAGQKIVDEADDRDEPFLMPHSERFGVLAWLDHRDWDARGIQLYVAGVDADLRAESPTVFAHPRFVAGLSDVNAVAADTNAVLIWSDERHGRGIADPKPEVYFETAWF